MKATIRKETLASLKELSQKEQEKKLLEDKILADLFQSSLWLESSVIATTLSMPIEFNTEKIIEKALEEGKIIGVPKTFGKGQMAFFNYKTGDELERTTFGVLEPVKEELITKDKIDLLIVPGVAFNDSGFRAGSGGGFYDRYLADYSGETCSLVFPQQLNNEFDPESHDLAVAKIFTI